MKIHLYTLCYNEMPILPFVIDYWKRIGISKAVVYDNYSTDGSDEYLSNYDWIEVRKFESDGLNDSIHKAIKNSCWKESKGEADFVIVCDIDECIYSKIPLSIYLEEMKKERCNVLCNSWYALCGDKSLEEIRQEYKEGTYLHQIIGKGYKQNINHSKGFGEYGKFILINPDEIEDIQWSVGQHKILSIKPYLKLYVAKDIITFHINKGFNEEMFTNRRLTIGKRLSDTNKNKGYGVEYAKTEEEIRQEYKNNQAKAIDISKL